LSQLRQVVFVLSNLPETVTCLVQQQQQQKEKKMNNKKQKKKKVI